MNIFDYDDYKQAIKTDIKENSGFRGYQSQLAEAMGCQRSFLSQVLGGNMDLTRDHAAELAKFWDLNLEESEYFLLLIDRQRAGSPHLKKLIDQKLKTLISAKSTLSSRIKTEKILDSEAGFIYYSSWYWSAIHVLLSIPAFRTVTSISEKLKLPVELVKHSLSQLDRMGLVKQTDGKWFIVKSDLHLEEDSPLTESNHTNWRQRAIIDVQEKQKGSTHYTSVFTMSKSDAKKLNDLLSDLVVKSRELIGPSPEEELYCFSCDFFRV